MPDISHLFGGQEFDTTTVEPTQDFEAVPPGKYLVEVMSSEEKQTKAGTGVYIEFVLEILEDGPVKGHKMWARMNMSNPNPKATEIGRRELAGISQSCGVPKIGNTDVLVGKRCIACVKVDKSGQNNIRAYEPVPGVAAQPVAVVAGPAVPPPAVEPAVQTPPAQETSEGFQTGPPKGSGNFPWKT